MNIKIGIVGASIAGLACAIKLLKLGFDITVFEKSTEISYARGAGIMLPHKLFEDLRQNDLVDENLKYFLMSEFSTFLKQDDGKQKLLTQTKYHNAVTVHWKSLHDALESKFDKKNCIYGRTIITFNSHVNYVELITDDNMRYEFDYVIFADGYNSLARKILFPEIKVQTVNYIAWRGLLEINKIDSMKLLGYLYNKEYYRYLYKNGHLLLFPIPNPNASDGDYIINWVLYENLDASNMHSTKKEELIHNNFLPGTMPKFYKDYLYTLAREYLPEFPCSIINLTTEPFTQIISDILLPQYFVGRIGLIGDASTLFRPHIGSNATKALQDAIMLGNFIEEEYKKTSPDLGEAFEKWSKSQNEKAQHLFPLAQALGKLLVTDVPDLATLDKEHMDELWSSTIDRKSVV